MICKPRSILTLLAASAVLVLLAARPAGATIVSLSVPNNSFELGSDPDGDGFNTTEGDFTACEGCRNPSVNTTYVGSAAGAPISDWDVFVVGFRFAGRWDPSSNQYGAHGAYPGATSNPLESPADGNQ